MYYKIYRRIRYIRYLKKKRKIQREVHEILLKAEQDDAESKAKEQLKKEKALRSLKKKQEDEYLRQQRDEVRANLLKNKELAQRQIDKEKAKTEVHLILTRDERKKRRKRLLKHYFRIQRRKFWKSILSFNYKNLKNQIVRLRESRDFRRQFGIIFLKFIKKDVIFFADVI